jgi:UDP-glucose 4-epimerase
MVDVPRVLLTGSSGGVGRVVGPVLADAGWDVQPFDLAEGSDLRDSGSVLAAMHGCAAVVHSGALAHDSAGSPADIVATNVLGTWHVLAAAEQCGLSRVVCFSSAQVFGFAEGEGTPAYLPVDDDHPLRASRPYGMSKRLAEEMCQAWTNRTGIPTIVLRPVLILSDQNLAAYSADKAELGAFVHVDDVAAATLSALTADLDGHHRLLLCGPGSFDTTRARTTLDWSAARTWNTAGTQPQRSRRLGDDQTR